ncbi:hypothetical protein WG66_012047, partial [Moniliophthora roreri]
SVDSIPSSLTTTIHVIDVLPRPSASSEPCKLLVLGLLPSLGVLSLSRLLDNKGTIEGHPQQAQ